MKNSVQVIFDKKPARETIPSVQECKHALAFKQALLSVTSDNFNDTQWMIEYNFDPETVVSYLLQQALKYYTVAYMNELNYTALCRGFVEGD